MWECPKCKREFKKENQDHYCGEPPKTIDSYIEAQPEQIQPLLRDVRNTIKEVLPNAQERISWSMPTFWAKHNIIHFAAFKNHLGIYPGEEAIVFFSDKLTEYKTSKGAIQFPYKNPIPLELIGEIALWCYTTRNHH